MRKLRVVLAAATMASAFVVVGAPAAHASCVGEPVDACAVACSIGLGNKYTAPAFQWCYVT